MPCLRGSGNRKARKLVCCSGNLKSLGSPHSSVHIPDTSYICCALVQDILVYEGRRGRNGVLLVYLESLGNILKDRKEFGKREGSQWKRMSIPKKSELEKLCLAT